MAEDLGDDSLRDFLDDLGLTPTPTPEEPRESGAEERIEQLLATADTDLQEAMADVTKEPPKAAVPPEIQTAPRTKPKQVATPKALKTPTFKTPKSKLATPTVRTSTPVPTRGGKTMYERSMLQIHERERKLKELQDKLMEDYTFTPKNANSSPSRSFARESSPAGAVFDRLYATETAATRAQKVQKAITPKSTHFSTPKRVARKDTAVTPSRIEALYASGQKSLRYKGMTEKVSTNE